MSSSPLQPTYRGFIDTTLDATIVFEACLSGRLNHVPRRPHDRERQDLIKSGNVFVYEENASGIKRWTDSVSWSPSRILGNYLIYRELEKPFPPGEKKRALKKAKKAQGGVSKPPQEHRRSVGPTTGPGFGPALGTVLGPASAPPPGSDPMDETDRALVGSLVDSYDFKPNGLVKKTISITFRGVPHHLVSYYNVEDVKAGRLVSPSNDMALRGISPRDELVNQQNFRAPPGNENGVFVPAPVLPVPMSVPVPAAMPGFQGYDQRMAFYQQQQQQQNHHHHHQLQQHHQQQHQQHHQHHQQQHHQLQPLHHHQQEQQEQQYGGYGLAPRFPHTGGYVPAPLYQAQTQAHNWGTAEEAAEYEEEPVQNYFYS
ncbi:hypothetical protein FHETE_7366 [Fusarium heterosporum]|uniref:Global transcription regulator sge1 n=1 Tax=Fusarium heterosporum TaxID=42747 RepID=A0A8H5WKX4_FUSHE|nr:hypothetical protein FHETE_7366 [Fusarium heterosporum]